MTVAVCHVMPALDVAPGHTRTPMPMPMPAPPQLDMWSAIQTITDDSSTKTPALPPAKASYPAPVRRSMSHESLALCTETLGSETGTRGDFLDQAAVMACLYQTNNDDSSAALADSFVPTPPALQEEQEQDEMVAGELTAVRYHRARPQRAFPPPLPSMSRRRDDDGPCLRMRPHRREGRLVMEAVAVKPQGYLHARRQGGRLRLCFVDCASSSVRDHQKQSAIEPQSHQEEEVVEEDEQEDDEVEEEVEEEEEEEDEVEVVDRGTVVEVVAASGKAQRCSRIVINKFVGGAPVTDDLSPSRCSRAAAEEEEAAPLVPGLRRVPSSTTTLAAAVAAASTGMEDDDDEEADNGGQQGEEKQSTTMLLFTSRVGDRAELVQSVRRCRQLRQRPLFIVEPYTVIAT
uniref:Uncharacterized protein n=1 Tax=Avena sativa TaxID=4498 RepID=A0ACD5W5P5_AVESA